MVRVRSFLAAMACFAMVMAQTVTAGETITYTYDALGRLVAVSTTGTAASNGQNVSTTFDPAGNRTNYTVTGVGGGGGGTPTVSINSVSATEGAGASLSFTVSLSAAASGIVTVMYATRNNTAVAGSDYTAISNTTLTFQVGETSKPVTVSLVNDSTAESQESMYVDLSAPSGATLGAATGTGTINDDDSGGGGGSCTVIVPSGFTTSSNYLNAFTGLSGTGMRDGNYTLAASTHGTDNNGNEFVTMDLGSSQTVTSVVVAPMSWGASYLNGAVLQRSTDGSNWTTVSGISGTTLNTETAVTVGTTARYLRLLMTSNWLGVGDFKACSSGGGGGPPTVSIANTANGSEPNTNGVLTVTQSATSASNTVISLSYAGTATNGTDYTRPSSVTIPAGQTIATVTLTVVDDTAVEGSETVIVTLSSVTSGTATIGSPSSATNTIADNDSGGGGGGSCTVITPSVFTTSSSYSANYSGLSGTGAGMRDGNYALDSSVHGTNAGGNEFVTMDLGSSQSVGSVVVVPNGQSGWGAAYLNGAQLQHSTDGTNWTTVTTVSGTANGTETSITVGATVRYLRLLKPSSYLGIGDFKACSGGGGGGGSPIVPQGYAASSNYNAYTGLSGNGPGMRDAVYNTTSSIHGTNYEASATITMDLGTPQTVGSVKVVPASGIDGWSASYLNGAVLERSTDGTNWTSVATVSGATGGAITSITVGATARYLRLRMTNYYLAVGDFYAVP